MKKIAVLQNWQSGKSTISKALAAATGLPLHQLGFNCLRFFGNGELVCLEIFKDVHDKIISSETWIIDGSLIGAFNQRLDAADTLIHINLPAC